MQRTLPRVVLDTNIIKKINKFYECKLPGRYLYRSCFSAPELSDHRCNALAPVEGGKRCEHCGHVPGQACPVTCHVAKFCLATYAYRLGIGGTSLDTAIARNLNTSYEVLYASVQRSKTKLSIQHGAQQEPEIAQDLDKIEHVGSLRGFADAFSEGYTRVPREEKKEEPEAVENVEIVEHVEETALLLPEEETQEIPVVVTPEEVVPVPVPVLESSGGPQPMFVPTFALPTVVVPIQDGGVLVCNALLCSGYPTGAAAPEVPEKPNRVSDILDADGAPLYTLPNAAKLVGISYNSLYEKVKKKQAEAVVIGKRSYMKKTEVERLTEEKRCHTKTRE